MPSAALEAQRAQFLQEAEQGFSANLKRGQPSDPQLALAAEKLTLPIPEEVDGYLLTNYPDQKPGIESARFGLPSVREYFAEELGCRADELLVYGNSSLALFGTMIDAYCAPGGKWADVDTPKVIIPVPGYDRHFDVLAKRGFEFIPVPIDYEGSGWVDMNEVGRIMASDRSVVGFLHSGIYHNPTGFTENTQDVVNMITAVENAAHPHARAIGDIAYRWHHIAERADAYIDAFDHLQPGQQDRLIQFFSTSKVTGSSDGLGIVRASAENLGAIRDRIDAISDRKTAQVREVEVLKRLGGIPELMTAHAQLLRPKLGAFLDTMEAQLGDSGLAHWTKPNGGYFSSVWVPDGKATEVVRIVGELGAALTGAGAGFPNNTNPDDNHFRVAFSREDEDKIRGTTERIAHAIRWVTD